MNPNNERVVSTKNLFIDTKPEDSLTSPPIRNVTNAQAVIHRPYISKGKLYVNRQLLEKALAPEKNSKK